MAKEKGEIRLGRLETQIMNVVWERGKATVHDVKEKLSKGRSPAYSTILTMMRKLEAKGYLVHDTQERTFVYRAAISRDEVRKGVISDLLERLFEGSPLLLLNSLVEQRDISKGELDEIKKLIDERKEK
jgi:predicted transcriptional regulator